MKTYEMITIETSEGLTEVLQMTDQNDVVSTIPQNPANSDYQAYLKHLTENPTEDVK